MTFGADLTPLDKAENVLLYMPSCHLVFVSPGNAVKEISIFIDYIRPPLRPAAGAMFYEENSHTGGMIWTSMKPKSGP